MTNSLNKGTSVKHETILSNLYALSNCHFSWKCMCDIMNKKQLQGQFSTDMPAGMFLEGRVKNSENWRVKPGTMTL